MSFHNMTGVDPQFTRLARNPFLRLGGYLFFPFYLALAGRGYKAVVDGQLAGYAFLHVRQLSGVIFNVSVNAPFRRQGIAQQLMHHLEAKIVQQEVYWAALQVDRDNLPAVRLYEVRGYRPVLAQFFQGILPVGIVPPGTQIEPLSGAIGRHLFGHYVRLELDAGEQWAAKVVKSEFLNIPAGGRFFRCLQYGQEVGCAWLGEPKKGTAVHFAIQPLYWGQINPLLPLLRLLVDQVMDGHHVEVYLSSHIHHQRARPILEGVGFHEQTRDRLLMLKSLG